MVLGNGKIRRWKREPNEFARRFDVDIGYFRGGIIVEYGTKALFLRGGELRGVLPPDEYDVGGIKNKWKEWGFSRVATVILVDAGRVQLNLDIENLRTKDVNVSVKGRLTVQLESPEVFFVNLMHGRELVEIHDLEEILRDEIEEIIQAEIINYSADELIGNRELKKKLGQDFEHQMKTTLEGDGLKLIQVNYLKWIKTVIPSPEEPEIVLETTHDQEARVNEESKIPVVVVNKSNQTIDDVELSAEFSNKLGVKNNKIQIGRLLSGDAAEEHWVIKPTAKGVFNIKPTLSCRDENQKLHTIEFKSIRITVEKEEIAPPIAKPEPPVPVSASITVLNGANKGEEYLLDKIAITKDIRIGRCHTCEIRMDENDRTISRHHARLLLENGAYFIEDTWSTNGTRVDGREINGKTRLYDGAKIEIGRAVLLFSERERIITAIYGRGMETIRLDKIKMREDIRIGRWPGCEIRIDQKDRSASRHHARIISENGEYFIEDICSAGGTFVDGEKIDRKRKLEDGDEIKIGKALMRFRSGGMRSRGYDYGTYAEG